MTLPQPLGGGILGWHMDVVETGEAHTVQR